MSAKNLRELLHTSIYVVIVFWQIVLKTRAYAEENSKQISGSLFVN